MKSLFRLFVLILLLGGWGLAALSVHVVRTPRQIPVTLITKENLDWRDTYVDTTKWTLQDVSRHPVVVERLIRTGKAETLAHVVDPDDGTVEQQLSDALTRAQKDDLAP